MKTVRIAELKSRLSEYLRAVRNGETIAVLDRETPVAQIVPVRERVALRIRKPAAGTPPPNRNATDRKSTRLNSSHRCISYAVFCLKKKKKGRVRIATKAG